MHRSSRFGLALIAAVGLLLAGCGDGAQDDTAQDETAQDETAQDETAQDETARDDTATTDQAPTGSPRAEGTGDEAVGSPDEDIEDGVYRGNGVALPVPDGWTIDPAAFQQGVVAAISDTGTQQMTARAVDLGDAASSEQPSAFESLVDGVRQQLPQEADIDEEVDLAGADRAQRLTFLDLPAQQEGAPDTSVTLVLAENDDGLIGEFSFTATTEAYDEDLADLLIEQAGFDPDSDPPAAPAAPAPPTPAPEATPEGQSDEG